MPNVQSAVGVAALLALAFAISENRRAVPFRQVASGVALTFVLAVLFLKIPQLKAGFAAVGDAVDAIAAATRAGTSFVFGYLGGGRLPFELTVPGAEFVFALQALPVERSKRRHILDRDADSHRSRDAAGRDRQA